MQPWLPRLPWLRYDVADALAARSDTNMPLRLVRRRESKKSMLKVVIA